MSRVQSTVNDSKPMADEEGIASQTAETTDDLTLADIVEASGIESFIEKPASEEEPEEASEDIGEDAEADEPEEQEELEEVATETDTPGVKKRIGKLIDRAEKAEERADSLEKRIAELESESKESPGEDYKTPGGDKFDEVTDFKELKKRETDAEHLRDWLLQNPEGGEYEDLSGATYDVDYDQAKSLMVETDRDLRKHIPAAKENIALKQRVTANAFTEFPWMKDETSSEFREMLGVIGQSPKAKKFYESEPYAIMLFGYAVEGFKSKAKKQPSTPPSAPKVPGSPSRAAPVSSKRTSAKSDKLFQRVAETGDQSDAESYILSKL